jgi:hypothetical protein
VDEAEFRKALLTDTRDLANSLEWRLTMTFDAVSDYVAR